MKKIMLVFSFVTVVVLALISFNGLNAEASDLDKVAQKDIQKLDKSEQVKIQKYENLHGLNERAATEDEVKKINEEIEKRLKTNNNVKVRDVLIDLGLEDVGYEEAKSSTLSDSPNTYEYIDDNSSINTNAFNIGSFYFRNASHNSTYLKATLYISNIGFTKLDSTYGWVTPYTKASNGAWIKNGANDYFSKTKLRVGTTSLGKYSAKHSNRGAKLTASGYIIDKGKVVTLNPASVIYNAR